MTALVGSGCSGNHGGRAEAWGHREAAGSGDLLERRRHCEGQALEGEWFEEA